MTPTITAKATTTIIMKTTTIVRRITTTVTRCITTKSKRKETTTRIVTTTTPRIITTNSPEEQATKQTSQIEQLLYGPRVRLVGVDSRRVFVVKCAQCWVSWSVERSFERCTGRLGGWSVAAWAECLVGRSATQVPDADMMRWPSFIIYNNKNNYIHT